MNEQKLRELQMTEQALHQLMMQKQQFQSIAFETENALKELDSAPKVFRIIGELMVESDKSKLKKDLEQKKELADVRIKSFVSQEDKLREKSKQLQKELEKELAKNE